LAFKEYDMLEVLVPPLLRILDSIKQLIELRGKRQDKIFEKLIEPTVENHQPFGRVPRSIQSLHWQRGNDQRPSQEFPAQL